MISALNQHSVFVFLSDPRLCVALLILAVLCFLFGVVVAVLWITRERPVVRGVDRMTVTPSTGDAVQELRRLANMLKRYGRSDHA